MYFLFSLGLTLCCVLFIFPTWGQDIQGGSPEKAASFTDYVALGKLLHLSGPHFSLV